MEFKEHKNKKHNKKHKNPSRSSQRIFPKNYTDQGVDRLKRLLQNQIDRTGERFYAIKIDGEFCIYKTSNIDLFDDYKEFIDNTTEAIEIVLYFGKSNNCNRHIFYLREKPLSNIPDPVDVEKRIEIALSRQAEKFQLKTLQEKVSEQEEYIAALEEELEGLRKKTDLRGILKESVALYGAIHNKPNLKSLSGATTPEPESVVEMQAHESEEEEEEIDEEELEEQELVFNQLYEAYGIKGIQNICNLAAYISESPSPQLKEGIAELLEEERKRKEETTAKKEETK